MTDDRSSSDEAARIRDAYARQRPRWGQTQYRGWMPGTLFMAQERERVTLDLLRRHGAFSPPRQAHSRCRVWRRKAAAAISSYGARPENLFGVDLLEDEVNVARELAPGLRLEVSHARQLPFEDADDGSRTRIHPLSARFRAHRSVRT